MDADTLLRLLQIVDSQLPLGGFAHSFGLEAYVPEDLTPEEVAQLARVHVVQGSLRCDLAACALARLFFPREEPLARLCGQLTAWRPVRGPREASLQMGRRLRQLAESALGIPCPPLAHPHVAVVMGCLSSALGVPDRLALAALAHASLVGLLAAATRCLRLGPQRAQVILRELERTVLATVDDVLQDPGEALWASTPAWDIRAHQQAFLTTRLFLS